MQSTSSIQTLSVEVLHMTADTYKLGTPKIPGTFQCFCTQCCPTASTADSTMTSLPGRSLPPCQYDMVGRAALSFCCSQVLGLDAGFGSGKHCLTVRLSCMFTDSVREKEHMQKCKQANRHASHRLCDFVRLHLYMFALYLGPCVLFWSS